MDRQAPAAPDAPAPSQATPDIPPDAPRRPRGLAALERCGVIDLGLLALAAAQWVVLSRLQGGSSFGQFVSSGRMTGLVLLLLAPWLLLAAGALAPLMRRRAAWPGELPPGAGLWLGAYGLMMLAWLVVVFNSFPDALWGFWHLARLDPREAAAAVALIPLVLAPGWRRLGKRLRHRLRKNNSQSKGEGPVGLRDRIPQFFFFLGLALWAWLLTDWATMSDGWGMVAFARNGEALGPMSYREPLFMLALQAAARLLRPLGLDAAQSIHLLNSAATLAALALIGGLMRRLKLSPAQRRAGWLLTLSSLGLTQMLMGRVELYPLLQLAVVATMVGAVLTTLGASPAWMCLAFAVGLAGHLSAVFVFPAVAVALWLWANPRGNAECGMENAEYRGRRLGRAALHLLGWGALIHVPLWLYLLFQLPEPTPAGLIQAVMGSLNTGAENETFIGSNQPTLGGQLGQLFATDNLFKMVQMLFYLAGGALLTMIVAGAARLGRGWRPNVAPVVRRQLWILAAGWAGYAFYAFTWHADWTWTEDWDLFSAIAPLTALLALRWLMPGPGQWRLPPALLRALCLFALALALTQHYFYHTRASYLGPMGKVALDPINGRLIQQHQIRHGWRRYHTYAVVDGKVVETKLPGAAEDEETAGQP